MKILLLFICLIIALSTVSMAQIPRAGTCGGCHGENFRSWQNSAHAGSISSARFRVALKRYLLNEDRGEGGFCFRCHAPAIVISGEEFEATKRILKGKGLKEGVTCVVCHSVESIKSGEAVYATGNIPSYHRVKDLKNIDREALCATCHNAGFKRDEAGVKKKGYLKGMALKLGLFVDKDSTRATDHQFFGTVPESSEDKLCPGLEGH